MALGRPPAISDYDIDVELPLDINEDISDPSIIHAASRSISDMPAIPATSLTSFIHHLRLKRIESEIQSTIYRVSSPVPADTVVIQAFLDRLSAWEQMLPGESRRFEDSELQPYDGIEAYVRIAFRFAHIFRRSHNPDGSIPQSGPPPPLSLSFHITVKHALPSPLRAVMRRGLPNLQTASPQHELRAFTIVSPIHLLSRPYTPILRLAFFSSLKFPFERTVDRLQYYAIRHDRALAISEEIQRCV